MSTVKPFIMKTKSMTACDVLNDARPRGCPQPRLAPLSRSLICAAVLLANVAPVHAIIPEPDSILYGTITLDNLPITAAQTNVVIEARRTTNGPAIASYRMGSDPQAGNFYSLRLQLESVTPINEPDASQVGDNLFIVLRDGAGVRGQTNVTIVERGDVQRVDFGVAVPDGDGDGLPDVWEILRFGTLGQSPGSLAPNGMTVLQNFIAGTNPNDPTDGFRLRINVTNDLKRVWFVAARADGPGYDGMTRLYTLEFRPVLTSGFWTEVPGYINIGGTNQTVNYFTASVGGPGFYRARISLLGFNVTSEDTDGDELPDVWETVYFGNLSRNGSSVGPNQMTALQSYTAGTDPNNPGSAFELSITRTNHQTWVSFFALRAQGAGYEGKSRFYSLELSTHPAGPFTGIASYTNILGNSQTVLYPSSNSSNLFFRGRVSLQGP